MEEKIDDLAEKAGSLGCTAFRCSSSRRAGIAVAEEAFKEIARLSKGAWFRFDRSSAATLAKLLSAVAVFATGGLKALEARGRPEDRLMIEHMRGGRTRWAQCFGIVAVLLVLVGVVAAFLRLDAAPAGRDACASSGRPCSASRRC